LREQVWFYSGLFAADYIAALDGVSHIRGGWVNGHFVQLGYQLAISVAAFAYSLVVSGALLLLMERVARLSLRTVEIEEMKGVDEVDIGETAYDWLQDNGRHGLRDGSFGEINQETEPKAEPVESVKEVWGQHSLPTLPMSLKVK
jgi:hypothetical protein